MTELEATLNRLAVERARAEKEIAELEAELLNGPNDSRRDGAEALLAAGGDWRALSATTAPATSPLLDRLTESRRRCALLIEADRLARARIAARRLEVVAEANAEARDALVITQAGIARDLASLVRRARELQHATRVLCAEGVVANRPGYPDWASGHLVTLQFLVEGAVLAGLLDADDARGELAATP
ncbi:MAG: hypothetical protein NTW56_02270 [Alphaproteobacteria bacterium]|nr:hypothetical protein [Alphaproteobacteria bacterium]